MSEPTTFLGASVTVGGERLRDSIVTVHPWPPRDRFASPRDDWMTDPRLVAPKVRAVTVESTDPIDVARLWDAYNRHDAAIIIGHPVANRSLHAVCESASFGFDGKASTAKVTFVERTGVAVPE